MNGGKLATAIKKCFFAACTASRVLFAVTFIYEPFIFSDYTNRSFVHVKNMCLWSFPLFRLKVFRKFSDFFLGWFLLETFLRCTQHHENRWQQLYYLWKYLSSRSHMIKLIISRLNKHEHFVPFHAFNVLIELTHEKVLLIKVEIIIESESLIIFNQLTLLMWGHALLKSIKRILC